MLEKTALKATALLNEHLKLNGKMVDFGGWNLPVQYTSVLNEHLAVRTAAGLFDVSHMGEIIIEGQDALNFLNFAVTNEVSTLALHQAQYSALCNEQGGIVDDLVIYRLAPSQGNKSGYKFFVVVNASNTEKDYDHFVKIASKYKTEHPHARFTVENDSSKISQIAIQGPKAARILSQVCNLNLSEIKTYWCLPGVITPKAGDPLEPIQALIARTGYTGEDGFELYLEWDKAPRVWNALLAAGASEGILPCGLGARDTLRLEKKYALYGHELTEETTPLETGLGWVTKFSKANFVGKAALVKQKEAGVTWASVGVKSLGRAIPRQGYSVLNSTKDKVVGVVTSGTSSPSLKCRNV